MGLRARLPTPEDVFLCWLVAQPDGCDLVAREAQIVRLVPWRTREARVLVCLFEALVPELRTEARPEGALWSGRHQRSAH